MEFQITLSAARVNAGMTQEDASKALGITRTTLRSYESGKTIPRADVAIAMCALYGVPVDLVSFSH